MAKNREKQAFSGCLVAVFFIFHFVSSWSPFVFIYLVVCKCVINLCFLSFVVMFLFFAVVVFHCFFSSLSLLCSSLFIQLFLFPALGSWCDKKPDQITEYLKFSFSCSASVPASTHFHFTQIITPTWPREEPLKWYSFALFVALNNVLNYLFLQCFLNINEMLPPKWAPIKAIMFHRVQNKNRCFRNDFL